MNEQYDAIVVGAGHNGLIAAVELAAAGWSVVVLEAGSRPGGALASGEITRPGYVHDLFATNLNLLLGSRFFAERGADLHRHGLRLRRSDHPYASVFPDGRHLGVTTDLTTTLGHVGAIDTRDIQGWSDLYALYRRLSGPLFDIYGTSVPSTDLLRKLARAGRTLGVRGGADLAQLLVTSVRELVDGFLHSPEAKALVASWGLHLDFGPDVGGGAMFPFLETFADMEGGMSIAEGGASRLVDALCSLLAEHGGTVRTSAAVRQIVVEGGRASAVELEGGARITATRAVLASVTPTALANELLAPDALPPATRSALQRYAYGPATMMVHLALSGSVPWAAGAALQQYAYVHVAPYMDDLARTYGDALAGRLPAEPLLVVGQTSTVDPTRAPGGDHVLWLQVRTLPRHILADPLGRLEGTRWDDAAEPYAERVLTKLERYAPGLSAITLDRAVLSPADLERHDRNLVGGDSISGSMHLRQNFLFRPAAGMSRYVTPIPHLLMIGAATWPGPGVNGGSGYQAARALLARQRWSRSRWRR